jgi:actin-like ATPase involved in cell morphogenesis
MSKKEDIITDDLSEVVKEVDEMVNPNRPIAIGLDVGTMNICAARSDEKDIRITRNVFLKLDPEEINISEMSDISYVSSEDEKELFIIGQDAFRLSNIFGKEVSRPMESGLISSKEIDAIEVLTLMLQQLIGNLKEKEVFCSYSIPAEAIDAGRSVTYHEKVFGRILSSLGINHTPVNEAMAIIYSECAKENFSGLALSFGAGMANTCISYRGIEALTFSTARSGDWVDQNVASSLNIVPNRVTSVKERNLNLEVGFFKEKNKKTRRILEALEYYYTALIEYTIKKIIKEFDEKVDVDIDEPIPIIVSGGTSMPKGFLKLFKETFNKYDIPFDVSGIRHAKNPLTSVSNGLLIRTLSDLGI